MPVLKKYICRNCGSEMLLGAEDILVYREARLINSHKVGRLNKCPYCIKRDITVAVTTSYTHVHGSSGILQDTTEYVKIKKNT